MKFLKQKSGFSLLELLLVVAVGSIILIAGLSLYRLISEQIKIADMKQTIATIISQADAKLDESDVAAYGFGTVITDVFVDLQIFPAHVVNNAGEPVTPWGGLYVIGVGSASALGGDYRIQMHTIPANNICIEVGQMIDYENSSDVVAFRINGTDVDDLSLSGVRAACDAAPKPIGRITIVVNL